MITSYGDVVTSLLKFLDIIQGNDRQKEADLLLSRGSMGRYVSQFMIEPELKVSKSLRGHEEIQNAINAQFEIFSSLYQTVFTMMLEVYGYDAKFAIQMLASRDFISDKISNEDDSGFPTLISDTTRKYNNFLSSKRVINPLSIGLDFESVGKEDKGIKKVFKELILTAKVGAHKSITSDSGDEKNAKAIQIKVLIAASIRYVDPNSIYNLIEVEGDVNAMGSRWDDANAGVISRLNFFLPLDMIRDYKKKRLRDKDDILKSLNNRKIVSASKVATNYALGFARFYQMITINNYEKERIETKMQGSLEKSRVRDKFLELSKSLVLLIMDEDQEMASFYVHSMRDPIDIPFRSLKSSSKSDTSEILKFLANRQF